MESHWTKTKTIDKVSCLVFGTGTSNISSKLENNAITGVMYSVSVMTEKDKGRKALK